MIPVHTPQQRPLQQQHPQQPLQQVQHEQQQYNTSQTLISPPIGLQARLPQDHAGQQQQRVQRAAAPKQRPASHYGARYNPMATTSSSMSSIAHSHIPTLPNIHLGQSSTGVQTSNYISSAQSSSPGMGPNQLFSSNLTMDSDLHPLSGSSGISIDGTSRSMPIHQASLPPRSNSLVVPSWPPSHIPGYVQSYEVRTILGHGRWSSFFCALFVLLAFLAKKPMQNFRIVPIGTWWTCVSPLRKILLILPSFSSPLSFSLLALLPFVIATTFLGGVPDKNSFFFCIVNLVHDWTSNSLVFWSFGLLDLYLTPSPLSLIFMRPVREREREQNQCV